MQYETLTKIINSEVTMVTAKKFRKSNKSISAPKPVKNTGSRARVDYSTSAEPEHLSPPRILAAPPVGEMVDPKTEDRLWALVRSVVEQPGLDIQPEWLTDAFLAERRKLVRRGTAAADRQKLYPTKAGELYVGAYDKPDDARAQYINIQIDRLAQAQARTLAAEYDVNLKDFVSEVVHAIYDERENLNKIAANPWDAIRTCARKNRKA